MTVSVQTTFNQATGNGVTTVFPYQFKILAAADLLVYINGTLQTLNADYSVAGVGADVGGSITFLIAAPASGAVVSIFRAMALKRTTDYQQLGDFLTTVVNPDFDRPVMMIQDLTAHLGYAIVVPPYEPTALLTLPAAAARALKFLHFDASGNVEVADVLSSGTPLSSSIILGYINRLRAAGAIGNDVADDTAKVTAAMSGVTPLTLIDMDGGRYKTTSFSNSLGAQMHGGGFISQNNVVKTPWGRRYPLSFGAELLWGFQSRVKSGTTFRATFTGDSTTFGTNVSAGYTVPELFLKAAQRRGGIGCTTVNRGQAGKSTVDWLATYLAGDLVPQPHLLVIRWGINDPYTGGSNLTAAQSIANIRTGLATIRATYGIKDLGIILCTPNSTSDSNQGRDERFYEQIIHGYRQAALDYQCAFLDIYSLCQDSRGGAYGTLNSAAQTYMDDPYSGTFPGSAIHPGDTMATVIASHLADLAFRGLELVHGGISIDKGTFYTKLGADLPATYPTGLSLFRTDVTGGTPFIRNGFVQTLNHPDDGQFQMNWGFGSALARSMRTRYGRAAVWDPWDNEWIAPTLTASWVNSAGTLDVAGYTRDMYGRVYLKGSIKNGTVVAGDIIMTLPAGYRPSGDCVFAVPCSAAIGQIKIIAASGQVQVLSGVNNTYLSLEGINFMAGN